MAQKIPTSTHSLRAHLSMARVAAQHIQQRQVVTEEEPEQVRYGKRDVLPVAVGEDMRLLRNSLLLQTFEPHLWQKKQEWEQPGEEQQQRTPMAVVLQASMRSTLRRIHGVTVSPNFSRNWFQPSSVVKSCFTGRGIYMPQSIKRGSGHENHRNCEAVMLAL